MTDETKRRIALKDPRYARLWGLPGALPVSPPTSAGPCGYLGTRVYPPLAPDTRRWALCLHPDKPLGGMVCPCKGCGPRCPKFDPDADPPSSPPPSSISLGESITVKPRLPDPPLSPVEPEKARETASYASGRPSRGIKWAYGVTTCAARLHTLLPRTLTSLANAGFDRPWVFADGVNPDEWKPEGVGGVTYRFPTIRTFGNWCLSLGELFLRNPHAQRFALFQDDAVFLKNLRGYLDACKLDPKTYWNLYTFPQNQKLGNGVGGWFKSNQRGLGAVALVFDRQGVIDCLTSLHMVQRPLNTHRGHRNVDGGVVTAMAKAGYTEMVHNPTLCQHTGINSSMGNKRHPLAEGWVGEVDAVELLKG